MWIEIILYIFLYNPPTCKLGSVETVKKCWRNNCRKLHKCRKQNFFWWCQQLLSPNRMKTKWHPAVLNYTHVHKRAVFFPMHFKQMKKHKHNFLAETFMRPMHCLSGNNLTFLANYLTQNLGSNLLTKIFHISISLNYVKTHSLSVQLCILILVVGMYSKTT